MAAGLPPSGAQALTKVEVMILALPKRTASHPHRGRGECRGHGEMPKGFKTSKEARRAEQSKNEGSEGGDRAGGAWGHSNMPL